ncbi:MAG: hypothetical protein AAGK04_13115 [Planctomycetota bacterium]
MTIAADEAVRRLQALSKRGKLPGFRSSGATLPDAAFDVDLFGAPFDQRLVAVDEGEGRLRLERRWKWQMPVLFLLVLIVSIEPGATLLKSFLPHSWGWLTQHLRWWYYPLTILQFPLVWRMVPKSRAAAIAHAAETIEKLRPVLDAEFTPAAADNDDADGRTDP